MKKYALTALVASACMAFSSVGYGAVFSDVGSGLKWAESYINSVYENGLMVGDYNSAGARVFRGTENITYSETAQLIYTMALKSGFTTDVTELGINRYSMEMSNEGIDQWAEKAVAFCMEKGIVSSYDLTKFKNNGQNAYISREDLTALFGKTLALSYTVSTGTSLSFNDTWNISQAARPYVELMNKMGVVTGDENNNFNPKANITRAETAVIASKAYDVMRQKNIANPESGYTQTTGTVVSVYESTGTYVLRLTTADGVAGFVLTDATPVYNNASSDVGPTGMGLGDTVTVYSNGASVARVVITNDIVKDPGNVNMPEFTNIYKDKGELISAGEYKIGLIDKRGDQVYYTVAEDADITLDGRKATLRQLSDRIRGDSYIEVTVELNSSTEEAEIVTAVEQEYTSDTEGRIKNINEREISIESGSKDFTYDLADSVKVKYNGNTISLDDPDGNDGLIDKFDDLTGSRYIDVKLTLNDDGEVEKIVAESSNYDPDEEDKEESGKISDIDDDDDKIKIGSKRYDLSSSVRVDITFGDDDIEDLEKLKDCVKGDVEIRADITVRDGEVTRIEGYVSEVEGTLENVTISDDRYPRGEMELDDIDGYGQLWFHYDEDTRIDIDGTEYDDINIESLRSMVRNSGGISDVTVRFDDDGIAITVKD